MGMLKNELQEVVVLPSGRRKVMSKCGGSRMVDGEMVGRTQQSFRDECNINKIMAKYKKQGVITHLAKYGGRYGEFGDALTYQEAVETQLKADRMFRELPAAVRKEFENDPAKFLEFVGDPKSEARMIELGLLPKKVAKDIPNDPKPVEPPPAAK